MLILLIILLILLSIVLIFLSSCFYARLLESVTIAQKHYIFLYIAKSNIYSYFIRKIPAKVSLFFVKCKFINKKVSKINKLQSRIDYFALFFNEILPENLFSANPSSHPFSEKKPSFFSEEISVKEKNKQNPFV